MNKTKGCLIANFATVPSLPQIMEMGNWSNEEMVMRYIRNIEAGKKAMIKLMRNAFDE
ncbi:hypothetical protein MPK88_23805 (plasmid) [Salmonella enterica subsp. enterica serovar Enteritidis]|nr:MULTISPECIES: hypothetical protein [Salmonella]WGL00110.1 hypothetical protein MPK88_23805 [Salmonella enterica subsp. enterica serovar Enteritidis]